MVDERDYQPMPVVKVCHQCAKTTYRNGFSTRMNGRVKNEKGELMLDKDGFYACKEHEGQ